MKSTAFLYPNEVARPANGANGCEPAISLGGEIASATKRLHGIAHLLLATNDSFGNIADRLHGDQPVASGSDGNVSALTGEMGELFEAIARLERVSGATSDLVGRFSRL